jgi:hypothetical protein
MNIWKSCQISQNVISRNITKFQFKVKLEIYHETGILSDLPREKYINDSFVKLSASMKYINCLKKSILEQSKRCIHYCHEFLTKGNK